MASDKDIIGKADALLRRHAVAPPAAGDATGGVPLLTDLVEDAARKAADAASLLPPEALAAIVAQVEARLAGRLEQRIVEQLVPQVHAAVAHALGDLDSELSIAIRDAIAEALNATQAR